MERNTIQFAYLLNDYYVIVTVDRDIKFINSDYVKPLDKFSKQEIILNPCKDMLKYVLTSKNYNLRDGLKDLFFGILSQLPENIGVFDTERTKFRVLAKNLYVLEPSIRDKKISEVVDKLWKKYSDLADDVLFDLIYESIYKVAENIPIELFRYNEGSVF